ncbi:MAG TPA: glycoside hydrolase family 95 protein [Firmicutes bacterium]|nr:glycoside hydrolase family 95 protein [Bacillota bacterium]
MKLKRIGAFITSVMIASTAGSFGAPVAFALDAEAELEVDETASGYEWKYGIGDSKGFNENTYANINKYTDGSSNSNWRNGSMTGNGEQAIIESGAPDEDTIIFNNTKLVLGSNEIFEVMDISENLDSIRTTAADRSNPGAWTSWVRAARNEKYGAGASTAGNDMSTNTKMYHPGAELRIKNNAYTSHTDYNRWTNFETGEIGSQWIDADGKEWNRRTFSSRADNVNITIIEAPEDGELDLTLSVDNLLEMGIDSASLKNKGIMEAPESKEIVEQDENGWSIGQIVKYGDFGVKGTNDYKAQFSDGGYATAVRVITDDGANVTTDNDAHTITANEKFNTEDDTQKFEAEITTPRLHISGGKSVVLISALDKQDDGLTDVESVKPLYDELLGRADKAAEKYGWDFSGEAQAEQAEYKPTGYYEGINGITISNVSETGFTAANANAENLELTLMAAQYDASGTLIDTDIQTQTVSAGGETVYDLSGEYQTSANTAYSRLFLLDVVSMIPYIQETEAAAPVVTELTELYTKMLEPHAVMHGRQFEGVELELCATDEEKADRELTNTELQEKQNGMDTINKAWLERLFYNGRFGLICASGYNTTRLGGIWVGNWMPDWSGDFTQDANVNLQVSSINTQGLRSAAESYMTYILRQVSDWEINAKNIYGIDDAIMAPPRTDGDGNGQIYHSLPGYPFAYWNAGADWLIIPIYEYWQCYGNQKIALGEDVDLNELESVLDLDEADKARIQADGFDLEGDILTPLIRKLYNFWQGYADERFYMSEDGTLHLNDGTTLNVENGDKYLFSPGYSPENVPSADGSGYNAAPSLAANTTMDVSAAHDSMTMLREFIQNGNITDVNIDDVDAFEALFPGYICADDGALKEWLIPSYEEHYNHRHVSHTYSAWPGYEAQNDKTLRKSLAAAMDMRKTYNTNDNAQAHGHLHNALVEARIKRTSGYETSLHTLVASGYEYAGLMTSHNKNHGSAFCTDNAFGLDGVIIESLLYSNTGEIEILPTLITDWSEGRVTGLSARTRVSVDELEWDTSAATATLTSLADDNTFIIKCGENWSGAQVDGQPAEMQIDENGEAYIELTLDKDKTVTVTFTLKAITDGTYTISSGSDYVSPASYANNAEIATSTEAEYWNIEIDANDNVTITNVESGRELTYSDGAVYSATIEGDGPKWKLAADGDGYKILASDGCLGLSVGSGNVTLVNAAEATVLAITPSASMDTGVVADSITIAASEEIPAEGVTPGTAVSFEVSQYVPAVAVVNGVDWFVVANDGEDLTDTAINSDGVLTLGINSKGRTLTVYAESPDGSCRSNSIEVVVADKLIRMQQIEMENMVYGFGNYKIETGRASASGNAEIGTIAGTTVLKYENVSTENLLSAAIKRIDASNTVAPATITLYADLSESSSLTYYDGYSRDPGEAAAQASKRYTLDGVNIDGAKAISDTVSISQGTIDITVPIDAANLGDTIDLYVVINTVGGQTWAGNYDYLTLNYEMNFESIDARTIEMETFAYGFGGYKIETGKSTPSGVEIGTISQRTVLKYEDFDFDNLYSLKLFRTNTSPAKISLYVDLTENEPLEYYDDYNRDSGEGKGAASRRYKISGVNIDSSKQLGSMISASSGTAEVEFNLSGAASGNHDLYIVIESGGQTWYGNYDYMEATYVN